MTEHVYAVTQGEFEARVVARSHEVPVVVDFWAEWCAPCRQLGPALEAAVRAREGALDLAKVDVDSNQMLSQSFGVKGIPAVKAFRDGRVVSEFAGAVPPAQIDAFLDALLPSEADRLADAGDEASLRAALEAEPRHAGAAVALARLLIGRAAPGDEDEARALLENHEAGDFLAAGLLARIALSSAAGANGSGLGELAPAFDAWDEGDRATALDLLQDVIVAEPGPERRDLLRRVMVAILTELGPADPLAVAHRRRLALALN